MPYIVLTQNSGVILGPIAKVLGFLMNGLFNLLVAIGLPYVALAIILFTVLVYLAMTPLTYKQQKFAKLQSKMGPELQAIQAKYKGKKDNESMTAMNAETQAVYAKYGVSPSGSCIQLAIQMPILLAMYRVLYAVPAYITKVKDAFFPLVDKLIAESGSAEFLQSFKTSSMYSKQFTNELFLAGDTTYVQNTYIDALNRASSADWTSLSAKFGSLSSDIDATKATLDHFNAFLGMTISESPWNTIKDAAVNGKFLIVIIAILIPVLAGLTQFINVKLMPNSGGNTGNEQADQMAQQMKTMNTIMPLMSVYFCLTLPVGMGLYWIMGAVIRTVQQIILNKKIDKIDFDALIEANKEKAAKKNAKNQEKIEEMQKYAGFSTRKMSGKAAYKADDTDAAFDEKASHVIPGKIKPGSMAEKAMMVHYFNENIPYPSEQKEDDGNNDKDEN